MTDDVIGPSASEVRSASSQTEVHKSRIFINAATEINETWRILRIERNNNNVESRHFWNLISSLNLALKGPLHKTPRWLELDARYGPIGSDRDFDEKDDDGELQDRLDLLTRIMRDNEIAGRSEEEEAEYEPPPLQKASNISKFFTEE